MMSSIIDTLSQVTTILKGTYSNFAAAKTKLKGFAKGRYSFMIENNERSANHESKTIRNLPEISIVNFSGKRFDLKDIIADNRYTLTVIDFWASWCVPCIAEFPFLKRIAKKLANKPIRFMGVSIDEDDKRNKWVEAAKKHGLFNLPFQYRLVKFKTAGLTSLINLKDIPRYIIIDNTGNIVAEDFLRPSSQQFELELLKQLDNLKGEI